MNVLQLFLLILALVLFVVATFVGEVRRFNLVAGGLAALTGAFLVGELG